MPITEELAKRSERLNKLRENPENLAAFKIHYKNNPVDFINDWGMTFDPRVKPSTIPFLLFDRQAEFVVWLQDKWLNRNDGLCEKSRDMGITWVCCAFTVWLWLFHGGQAISWGSRKEGLVDKVGDPDSIFEKMRFMIARLPKEFRPHGYDEKKHATYMKIINPENGSTITGEAGDNIGRGGRSSMYFKDESAFYERPEKIEAALSQNSDVKIDVSTPNGNGNPFYRKRFGGEIDVFTFHWKDDPRKDEEWYRKQKRLLDPVIVAQEIDISYDASVDNVLIKGDIVDEAMRIRPTDLGFNEAPASIGVDVARFGSDRTVITTRKGRVWPYVKVFQGIDTMQIVGHIMTMFEVESYAAIFVDVTGVGSGVADRLREVVPAYCRVYDVNFGGKANNIKYADKRAEIWGEMNEWLKGGGVSIPNHPDIKTDLCGLQYKFNSNGQLLLEKKEDAKKRGVKSPDIGDAFALTFAEPVVYFDSYEDFQDYYDEPEDDTGY